MNKVYQIVPVRLNQLHAKQIQGKTAIIIGWGSQRNKILLKANVKILTDDECLNKVRLMTDGLYSTDPDVICTFATPYISLDWVKISENFKNFSYYVLIKYSN